MIPRTNTGSRHQRLPEESSNGLGALIREARDAAGWSRETLSVRATDALRAGAIDFRSPIFVASEERDVWATHEVTARHIEDLEGGPAYPASRDTRRATLRGVCIALGLDFSKVWRFLGV